MQRGAACANPAADPCPVGYQPGGGVRERRMGKAGDAKRVAVARKAFERVQRIEAARQLTHDSGRRLVAVRGCPPDSSLITGSHAAHAASVLAPGGRVSPEIGSNFDYKI